MSDSPSCSVSYSLKVKEVMVSGKLIMPFNVPDEVFTLISSISIFEVILTPSFVQPKLPKEQYPS